jgi:TATA-binding protein-associated factor
VIPYLRNRSWETRVAAAKAVGGIVTNAEKFDPNADDAPTKTEAKSEVKSETNGHAKIEDGTEAVKAENDDDDPDLLDLNSLELGSILKYGRQLLGSAGKEYDYKLAAMDPAARLAHQKKSLTARLGLGGQYAEDDILSELDLAAPIPGARVPMPRLDTTVSRSDSNLSASHASPPGTPMDGDKPSISKRQMNALKRKAKKEMSGKANKVQIVDLGPARKGSHVPQTPGAQPQPIKLEPRRKTITKPSLITLMM